MLYFGADIVIVLMLGMIGIVGVNVLMHWNRQPSDYIENATAACIYLVAWMVVMYTILATILL